MKTTKYLLTLITVAGMAVCTASANDQITGSSASSKAQGTSGSTTTGTGAGVNANVGVNGRSADLNAGVNTSDTSKLDHHDSAFLRHVAMSDEKEIHIGELAMQKGSSEAVKSFGKTLVDDHTQNSKEVNQIASEKGLALSSDKGYKETHSKLDKLSGADFDREFADMMVKDHKKDVKEFQKAAQNCKDAEVKSFAEKTLPVLEKHLSLAESLQTQSTGTTSTTSTPNRQ